MKLINVKINSNDVFEVIKNVSAYIGAKTPDAQGQMQYDQIAIFDEDSSVIKNLWSLAMTELMRLFNRYLVGSHNNTNTMMDFNIEIPSNVNTGIGGVLVGNAKNFLAYCMLSKWCDIANREDAKIYEESMQNVASAIKEALYSRTTYSRTDILNKTSWK